MKRTHVNIPVFIPHLGCPNMCVFCNQRAISGVSSFVPEIAKNTIDSVLSTIDPESSKIEIAFFGGSFTGIDRNLMISLLDLGQSYVNRGYVSGMRMSTRPDYINCEIISILKNYTITAVELGVQSFSDNVLNNCRRGHNSNVTRSAFSLLKDAGIPAVGQMMIGLPGATEDDEVASAEEICKCSAVAARIYPTIVFKDTELYNMTLCGVYKPLTIEEAIVRSANVLEVFVRNNVECLRIGLCESENLHSDSTYFAGPNHPALGELVYGEIYYRILRNKISDLSLEDNKRLIIYVPKGDISLVVGQNKRNLDRIKAEYSIKSVKFVEIPSQKRYNITLELN